LIINQNFIIQKVCKQNEKFSYYNYKALARVMTETTTTREVTDEDIIEANRRAYDKLDKREARNDRKDEIAGKVLGRIKTIKKLVK